MDAPGPSWLKLTTHAAGGPRLKADMHCHCLPGLDDGPATTDESLALCRELAADGVGIVVATPHQLGRYDGRNSNAQVRQAVAELRKALAADGIHLKVEPGGDVRIDERLPELIDRDEVMTLCDQRRYVLVELPSQTLISPESLAADLAGRGIRLVVTHPERCAPLCRDPETAIAWVRGGVLLQLTAGSILGEFGRAAREASWYLLRRGAASFVAGDEHGTAARRPRMSQALRTVGEHLGHGVAETVFVDNPLRAMHGQQVTVPMNYVHTEMRRWGRTPSSTSRKIAP
jgi:protein-tyrosine phosphatase